MAPTLELVDRLRRRRLPSPQVAKAIRTSAGATQAEIAEAVGVDRSAVTQWESGTRRPDREHAEKYAEVLRALNTLTEVIDDPR